MNLMSVNDAREAFLVELASFQLTLKKSTMICEAEARQVEEYQKERQRIGESGICIPFSMCILMCCVQTTSMGR